MKKLSLIVLACMLAALAGCRRKPAEEPPPEVAMPEVETVAPESVEVPVVEPEPEAIAEPAEEPQVIEPEVAAKEIAEMIEEAPAAPEPEAEAAATAAVADPNLTAERMEKYLENRRSLDRTPTIEEPPPEPEEDPEAEAAVAQPDTQPFMEPDLSAEQIAERMENYYTVPIEPPPEPEEDPEDLLARMEADAAEADAAEADAVPEAITKMGLAPWYEELRQGPLLDPSGFTFSVGVVQALTTNRLEVMHSENTLVLTGIRHLAPEQPAEQTTSEFIVQDLPALFPDGLPNPGDKVAVSWFANPDGNPRVLSARIVE